MRTGKFRHRVTIEKLELTKDATGSIEVWKPVSQKWCAVADVTSSARNKYNQEKYGELSHTIEFRTPYPLGLGKHRIIWGKIVLEPMSSPENPDTRNKVHLVRCKTVTNEIGIR